MKIKIILIVAAALLLIGAGFVYWRWSHIPKKKAIIPRHAVVKEAVKKKALPEVQKKFANPKVAIVIDDFGYNMSDLGELFAIKKAVTFSILPNLRYSRRIAELARSKGYEIILHLPLEANDRAAPAEPNTIKTGMNAKEVDSILDKDVASIPGLKGVSNHQGSKATEDKAVMALILQDLKQKNLYFFDSFVTDKSICQGVARSLGVPCARRDMFLDNMNSQDYIEKQVLSLRRFAFRKGSAIAICHDRKNTIAVLCKMMPELAADGIVFVSLSDMVR